MAELEHIRLASFLYILPIAGIAYCPRVTRCRDLGHDSCHPGRIEASCRPASRVGNVGREILVKSGRYNAYGKRVLVYVCGGRVQLTINKQKALVCLYR